MRLFPLCPIDCAPPRRALPGCEAAALAQGCYLMWCIYDSNIYRRGRGTETGQDARRRPRSVSKARRMVRPEILRVSGRIALTVENECSMSHFDDVSTIFDNRSGTLLPGAGPAPAAPVRGAARLLRRRGPLGGGGAALRLHGRLVQGPVPQVPTGGFRALLPGPPAGPAGPGQEGSGPPPHHRPAEAEPLHLRHQRRPGAEGHTLSPAAIPDPAGKRASRACPAAATRSGPSGPAPSEAAVADVRQVPFAPRFRTRFGGLFLFLPYLVRLDLDGLLAAGRLPRHPDDPRRPTPCGPLWP